jgi:hypothetical protein
MQTPASGVPRAVLVSSDMGLKFTTFLHLVKNLRISGDITLHINGVNSEKLSCLISLIPALPEGEQSNASYNLPLII